MKDDARDMAYWCNHPGCYRNSQGWYGYCKQHSTPEEKRRRENIFKLKVLAFAACFLSFLIWVATKGI